MHVSQKLLWGGEYLPYGNSSNGSVKSDGVHLAFEFTLIHVFTKDRSEVNANSFELISLSTAPC